MTPVRIVAWALVVILWGASAVNYATRGAVARNGHVKGGDYAHFYIMGRFAAQHKGAELYDAGAQKAEFARALPGVEIPNYLPFLYGPQAALLLAPFGVLPYFPSLFLWWSAMAAVYLLCCRAVWSNCPRLARHPRDLLLLAFAYPGFWELFIYGHTTWIALGCLTVFCLALQSGRWLLAGIAIGVLAYKPQLGIGVFLVLLASWNWRVLLAAVVTVGLHGLAAWLWFGGAAFEAYGTMLRSLPAIAPLVEPQQFQLCSIRGFFTALDVPGRWATIASLGTSAVVCWWMLVAWSRRSRRVGFAVLLAGTILISPHETLYDLVLLAPALLLLAEENLACGGGQRMWVLLGAVYLLALSGAIVRDTHVQLASPVLIAVVYFATFVMRRGRDSTHTTTPAPPTAQLGGLEAHESPFTK